MTSVEKVVIHDIPVYIIRCLGMTHLDARQAADWFRARHPEAIMVLLA